MQISRALLWHRGDWPGIGGSVLDSSAATGDGCSWDFEWARHKSLPLPGGFPIHEPLCCLHRTLLSARIPFCLLNLICAYLVVAASNPGVVTQVVVDHLLLLASCGWLSSSLLCLALPGCRRCEQPQSQIEVAFVPSPMCASHTALQQLFCGKAFTCHERLTVWCVLQCGTSCIASSDHSFLSLVILVTLARSQCEGLSRRLGRSL